jgi:hypothetical protein
LEMKEFLNAVLQIENYWLQLIKLPSNRNWPAT